MTPSLLAVSFDGCRKLERSMKMKPGTVWNAIGPTVLVDAGLRRGERHNGDAQIAVSGGAS
jgi:hypothetical protein